MPAKRQGLAARRKAAGFSQEQLAEAEERVSHALTHPGSTDLVTVAGLRSQVQHLDEQYVHVPSTSRPRRCSPAPASA